LIEKVIILENVSLVDFLGVGNANIKEIAAAFPASRIISRGNEIRIQGRPPEIIKINAIIQALLEHYHRYGHLTVDKVQTLLQEDSAHERSLQELEEYRDEILLYGVQGAPIKPRTLNQMQLVKASFENDLVFALGPAGDLTDKVDPYLRPIYDALDDMIPAEKFKFYEENRVIEIAPLAYMRGRTLHDAFVLLDEAQNTTPMQMKMFLTRMGPNSKVIVTGDHSQIDLPSKQRSGLVEAMQALRGVKGIGFVELTTQDVVRHKLVKSIIKAYEKYEGKQHKDGENN
jgi:phosphate starvation-inducible PhoH-like protein